MMGNQLYMKRYTTTYWWCLSPKVGSYVLREIHEDIYGNHSNAWLLVHKMIRQGYYWSTMQRDAIELVLRCDKCQRYVNIPMLPPEPSTPILSPWPFAKCGIDLISQLPITWAQAKFSIMIVDYFTKWVKAKPLSKISKVNYTKFIWKNIIFHFGIPHSIFTNNRKKFDNPTLGHMCLELGIHKSY